MSRRTDRLQVTLARLSGRWWLYLLLCVFFFVPSSAERGYDPRQSSALVEAVLRHPFIAALSPVYVLFKLVPVLLVVLVMVFGNRFRTAFHGYVTLLLLAIALFQNSASTERFGLVIIIGNVALMTIVALSWLWETVAQRGDYSRARPSPWKWPFFALAVFAFWFPVNSATVTPDFNLVSLAANESMLTYCMVTPVLLAFLLLYFPRVNIVTFRISAFVGLMFGVMNAITWFVLKPSMWWMGVLHLPLLLVSLLCFVLSLTPPEAAARRQRSSSSTADRR
jgi:hypothetical protein